MTFFFSPSASPAAGGLSVCLSEELTVIYPVCLEAVCASRGAMHSHTLLLMQPRP
jgi:hypothetical protein